MFSTPNRHVAILSLLVQKVMQKRQCFTLLLDMGPFWSLWDEKAVRPTLRFSFEVYMAKKMGIFVSRDVDFEGKT